MFQPKPEQVHDQYSRQECLDIAGNSLEVSGKVLDEKVLNIFDKMDRSFSPDCIESYHCISKKIHAVIFKFSQQKDCQRVKKDFQKLKMDEFDLPRSNTFFINRSLCPCYKVIWSKSKKNYIASVKFIVFFLQWHNQNYNRLNSFWARSSMTSGKWLAHLDPPSPLFTTIQQFLLLSLRCL